MQLYTVKFTTKKMIKKYDAKGKLAGETSLDTPVCLTALPYATAMSYSIADNFTIEDYTLDQGRQGRAVAGIGNGTKKVDWDMEREVKGKTAKGKSAPAVKPGLTEAQRAAVTGNLGAAINA